MISNFLKSSTEALLNLLSLRMLRGSLFKSWIPKQSIFLKELTNFKFEALLRALILRNYHCIHRNLHMFKRSYWKSHVLSWSRDQFKFSESRRARKLHTTEDGGSSRAAYTQAGAYGARVLHHAPNAAPRTSPLDSTHSRDTRDAESWIT